MNEVLFFVQLIVMYSLVVLALRFFGKKGVVVWIVLALIMCDILALKLTPMFGLVVGATMIYSVSFVGTDIICELYGKKEAQKIVLLGLFCMVGMVIITQLFLKMVCHPESEWANPAYIEIFGFYPRIVFASIIATAISQFHDIWAYQRWREMFPKHLWLRNNGSTMISQIINIILFNGIAFYGVFSNELLLHMSLACYLCKFIFAAIDTPFIYLAKYLWDKDLVPDKKETLLLQKSKKI